MRKQINPKDFERFLINNGYNSSKYEYISKDCTNYRVKDIASGKEFFIRY